MKIGFISLGCAKNLVDSEYLIALFEDPFFEIETDPKKCDAILINTCGFIESAKTEAIDTILEMAELKNTHKLKYLIATGCLVQRYKEELMKEIPEVDLFMSIKEYCDAPKILGKLFNHEFKKSYGKNRKLINSSYMAYLRIADGCDNRCAYCAIPLIRGNCRSVPMEDLIFEANRLHDLGVKELNIVAQDTTVYGRDLYGKLALKDLIRELDKIDFKWIRILYMYPDEIEDELLEEMKKCKRVLPYFDIPTQYGEDTILKLMNRRGSTSMINDKIAQIKKIFPEAYIRTTMIVGFPHENEETFNSTLEFVKLNKFDSLGAFTYSKEDDTPACDMDEEVDEFVAKERLGVLMSLQKMIVDEKLKSMVGKELEVLVEKKAGREYVCRSWMSAPDGVDSFVYVKGDDLKIGEFVQVKVTGYRDYDLLAEIK